MKMKLLVSMIVLCGLPYSLMAAPVEMIMAYENKEQPLYYYGTTEVPPEPGVAVEMVMLLEEKIPGLKISFVRHPWKRCQVLLQNGKVDGIFKASFKPERLKIGAFPMENREVDPSRRIAMMANSLYKHKDSVIDWDGETFINLDDGVIGAPRGYFIVSVLRDKGVTVEEADTSLGNLKKLVAGRLTAVALQDVTGDLLLNRHPEFFKDIVKVQPPLTAKPQYLMLSHQFVKTHPELAEKVWDTIAEIRENELNRIAIKYIDRIE